MKAIWNGKIIAESEETVVVEGNHYFPSQAIKEEFFSKSSSQTTCPWKGQASYYNINVEGEENKDAAWYYRDPKERAESIKGYVAFWRGVEVVE